MAKPKKAKKPSKESQLIPDVRDQRRLIAAFLNTVGDNGKKIGDAICGVYAFFDFDGAAIYVGQTVEKVRTRVRRHMTNRRTDAVAMKVLDPMEVAVMRVWPFWDLQTRPGHIDKKAWADEKKSVLDAAEWTVYSQLREKQGHVIDILNEKLPPERAPIGLPRFYDGTIIAQESIARLYHPDERIARRALTISALAQVIRERDVSLGLRRTLMTQANRLHRLAKERFDAIAGETPPAELKAELEGHEGKDIGDEDAPVEA